MSTNRPTCTLFFVALFLFFSGMASATPVEIHVLFAYTAEAGDDLGGAPFLEAFVTSNVHQKNNLYVQKGIDVELVPHFFETDWADESIYTMASMRIKLRQPNDGDLDDVFAQRDAVGADLVVLFVDGPAGNSSALGVSYTNGSLGLTSSLDLPVLEDYAYAVVRTSSLSVYHHELMHLMGLNHPETDQPNSWAPVLNANAPYVAGFRDANAIWDVCAVGCASSDLAATMAAAPAGATVRIGPGSYVGAWNIDKDLTLRGAGVMRTFLDGAGADSVVSNYGSNVTISHLTITGGDGMTGSGVFNAGGLTLDEVVVTGNTGPFGGAIFNVGTLEMIRCRVHDNRFDLPAGFGGGLTNFNTVNLTDCRIEFNEGYLGGGLHNSGGQVDMLGGWIERNDSISLGGGYSNHNVGGTVTLDAGWDQVDQSPLAVEDMLYGNDSATDQYTRCYDINEPVRCPVQTAREICLDQFEPIYNACRAAGGQGGFNQACFDVYMASVAACEANAP